jgi:hypothetical protein
MAWTTPGTATAGEVLTAAFWNTNVRDNSNYLKSEADANGLVFITSGTNSNASSLSINSCFSATYDIYKIVLSGTSLGGEPLNLRMRASGTDATGNDYTSQRIELSVSTGTTVRTTATSLSTIGFVSGRMNLDLTVTLPASAINTTFAWNGGGGTFVNIMGGGVHSLATAYDGLTLLSSAGALFTATAHVYGYRKS